LIDETLPRPLAFSLSEKTLWIEEGYDEGSSFSTTNRQGDWLFHRPGIRVAWP